MSSPKVTTKEIDLTFSIQSAVSNGTGYVGLFRWGPVDQIVPITTNESELVRRFGQPDAETSMYFHAASNYLLYSVPLMLVRIVGENAVNAMADDSIQAGEDPILVRNDDDADNLPIFSTDSPSVIAKYPGSLGNSLKIVAAGPNDFEGWAYEDQFDYAPGEGQFNLAVIDEDGLATGTAGSVIETYELMSATPGAKKPDGTTAYIKEAVKNQSDWIIVVDEEQIDVSAAAYEVSLSGGVDDNDPANADFSSGFALFENKEQVDVIRVFTSGADTVGKIRAIDVVDKRKDCVAFTAPELSAVYNNTSAATDVKDYYNTEINKPSSYHFPADNWKMVYDKYNDKNIWIPCDSDAAGLHARLFVIAEPWYSPAGLNRGQLKNVIKLAWSANEEQRNVLYKNSINSIISIPGEGTVLWGDKTALRAPSAFSRINVRTLFIVLKKNIARAARYQLFELNDAITRALFRNATDAYLDQVQSRRGILRKRVVCDETNNTAQVLADNGFVGSIFIDPARSINYITLNFVAINGNVQFDEVEGSF